MNTNKIPYDQTMAVNHNMSTSPPAAIAANVSEPPSPIHVSESSPNSREMFNKDGETFKKIILDKANWVNIHFPNGVASRAVVNQTQDFIAFMKGMSRLQPYHDKFSQMTLWHMDKNPRTGEFVTNISKGTIPFSDLASNYLGMHLNFIPMDSQIKSDMKYNKAKHDWEKVSLLDSGRLQQACRFCHIFTGVSKVLRCKTCKMWIHKDCKAKINSDCDTVEKITSNSLNFDSADEENDIGTGRWLSIRDSPSADSKKIIPQTPSTPVHRMSQSTPKKSNGSIKAPNLQSQYSRDTVFEQGNHFNFPSVKIREPLASASTSTNYLSPSSHNLYLNQSDSGDEMIDLSPKIVTDGIRRNEDWRIDFKKITFEKEIGQGAYGTVWQCQWFGKVAVKLLNVKNPTDNQLKDFYNEIKVLRGARHPNILNFMGFCHRDPSVSDEGETIGKSLAIVTEFCEGQTLYHHIHISETSHLLDSLKSILLISKQIADGMNYLTNNSKVTHRDLKTQNVFLTDGKPPTAKIGDFGLAKVKSGWTGNNEQQQKSQMCGGVAGTIIWMAPEICSIKTKQLEEDDGGDVYSQKSDVYAYGVMLYEMFSRSLPFRDIDNVQIILFQVGMGFASIKKQLGNLRKETPI